MVFHLQFLSVRLCLYEEQSLAPTYGAGASNIPSRRPSIPPKNSQPPVTQSVTVLLRKQSSGFIQLRQCYVRGTVGEERMPAFSMKVRKPDEGEPEIAVRIRAAASSYTTPVKEIVTKEAESEVLVELHHLRSDGQG